MVNSNLLKAKYREKGMTQEEVANAVGMHPSSLSQKQNNVPGHIFTLEEIDKLSEVLNLSKRDCVNIFLVRTCG